MVLNVSFALSLVTGLLPHHLRICLSNPVGRRDPQLDPASASGPPTSPSRNISLRRCDRSQVFQLACNPSRAKRCRATASSRVPDDHDTPLLWGGIESLDLIWKEIFSENRKTLDSPVNNSHDGQSLEPILSSICRMGAPDTHHLRNAMMGIAPSNPSYALQSRWIKRLCRLPIQFQKSQNNSL